MWFIGIILSIIGIFLNLWGILKIRNIEALVFINKSMIIKIISNALFIIGWLAKVYGYPSIYVMLFIVSGFLVLLIAIIIFWGVHREIYVEKTEFVGIPLVLTFMINGEVFTISRVRTLMIGAFGTGLVFMASLFAIYGCYKLYTKRKGGATIWLLVGTYTLAILAINTLGLFVTFYDILGIMSTTEIMTIHLSSLVIPDFIAFLIAFYYETRVRPILESLK